MNGLARWEGEWLLQMLNAFQGAAWDTVWLRRIGRQSNVFPLKAKDAVSVHPKRKASDHAVLKRALYRAAKIVERAVKSGELLNLKSVFVLCVDCKISRATLYEHRDYAKPLEVEPTCQKCNMKRGPAILSAPVPTRKRKAV